ncbi:MAG: hypothetical protein ABW186_07245, partial [Rhodanobacteraceae bacterium]
MLEAFERAAWKFHARAAAPELARGRDEAEGAEFEDRVGHGAKRSALRDRTKNVVVIPAKAGIHFDPGRGRAKWIPAFAGMTGGVLSLMRTKKNGPMKGPFSNIESAIEDHAT